MNDNTAENLNQADADLLLVVSKVKRFIRESSELSSSADFFTEMNKKVVALIQQSIESAKSDKRKTVMGRDVV